MKRRKICEEKNLVSLLNDDSQTPPPPPPATLVKMSEEQGVANYDGVEVESARLVRTRHRSLAGQSGSQSS